MKILRIPFRLCCSILVSFVLSHRWYSTTFFNIKKTYGSTQNLHFHDYKYEGNWYWEFLSGPAVQRSLRRFQRDRNGIGRGPLILPHAVAFHVWPISWPLNYTLIIIWSISDLCVFVLGTCGKVRDVVAILALENICIQDERSRRRKKIFSCQTKALIRKLKSLTQTHKTMQEILTEKKFLNPKKLNCILCGWIYPKNLMSRIAVQHLIAWPW